VKVFDADKIKMCGGKLWRYVKPFSSDPVMLRTDRHTDGQTDRIAISMSHVNVLTCDKKCAFSCSILCSFYLAILTVLSAVVVAWLSASWSLANVCFCLLCRCTNELDELNIQSTTGMLGFIVLWYVVCRYVNESRSRQILTFFLACKN